MINLHDEKSSQNGQILAIHNELQILSLLQRFGWLRTRDLAELIWHKSASANSATVMAQRTLKRLKDSVQVLNRLAPDGATIYALSQSGARRLGEETGIDARSGKDLIRELGNYEHRCLANLFAINRIHAGQKIWTEREIQANKAPIKSILRKVPDCLIELGDGTLAWVEIERGYKKLVDFNKMLGFFFHVLGGLDSGGNTRSMLFCAATDIYIEQGIIQVISNEQSVRIINAVKHNKKMAPYDYSWGNIVNDLFLCMPNSNELIPISHWIKDFEQ